MLLIYSIASYLYCSIGLGATGPDPSATKTLSDGVQVPLGQPVATGITDSSLLYNE